MLSYLCGYPLRDVILAFGAKRVFNWLMGVEPIDYDAIDAAFNA